MALPLCCGGGQVGGLSWGVPDLHPVTKALTLQLPFGAESAWGHPGRLVLPCQDPGGRRRPELHSGMRTFRGLHPLHRWAPRDTWSPGPQRAKSVVGTPQLGTALCLGVETSLGPCLPLLGLGPSWAAAV